MKEPLSFKHVCITEESLHFPWTIQQVVRKLCEKKMEYQTTIKHHKTFEHLQNLLTAHYPQCPKELKGVKCGRALKELRSPNLLMAMFVWSIFQMQRPSVCFSCELGTSCKCRSDDMHRIFLSPLITGSVDDIDHNNHHQSWSLSNLRVAEVVYTGSQTTSSSSSSTSSKSQTNTSVLRNFLRCLVREIAHSVRV